MWNDRRNRMRIESVKAEICEENFGMTCQKSYKFISKLEQVALLTSVHQIIKNSLGSKI
jgi:hypothetical protein